MALIRFVSVVCLLSFGSYGFGQVSTTKRGIQDKVSSQSADIQYRNYVNYVGRENSDAIDTEVVINQIRSNIKVGLYNDRVMNTLVLGVNSTNAGSQLATQRRPEFLTEVYAVQSKYFDFTPYVHLHLPQDGYANQGDLGIVPMVKSPVWKTGIGNFSFSGRVEAEAQFYSQPQDIEVTNADEAKEKGFSLTASEEGGEETFIDEGMRSPVYEVNYVPSFSWDMSPMVKGLSFGANIWNTHTYTQRVKIDDKGEKNYSYSRVAETDCEYILGYKVNDLLSVSNAFYTTHAGTFEARGTNERYMNRVLVAYKLY